MDAGRTQWPSEIGKLPGKGLGMWECLRKCKAVCAVGTYPHLWSLTLALGCGSSAGRSRFGMLFPGSYPCFSSCSSFLFPCFTTFSPIRGWWCFSGTDLHGWEPAVPQGEGIFRESAENRREGILRSVPRRK